MRVCGLVAAVVALGLSFPASAEADIVFFTDRAAWESAAGPVLFTEDFSGFPVDTPFRSSHAALNGMAIQQVGTERMAWNQVDVPPHQFSPNSGSSSGLLLTNFPEGRRAGIQVSITFTGRTKAFGFDSWSGNDGEGAVLAVFSGAALLGSQALTGGDGDFLGYVLTGEDTSSAVRFRSDGLIPGMVGERFYIDNLAGTPGVFQDVTAAFLDLFPADTVIEKPVTGFPSISEGPLWNGDGFLLFTLPFADRINKWSPEGGLTLFRQSSNGANGLTYDRQRRLIACERGRLTRTETDGTVKTLTSANAHDAVVKSDGAIYFTSGASTVSRMGPDGIRTTAAEGFGFSNGLAFSPDEKRLYVGDSTKGTILVYDVTPAGMLENGRPFAATKVNQGTDYQSPAGMKVDRHGNLYCASQGAGLWVFDPKGAHLGTIQLGEGVLNCAWGDADGKSLYITAISSLYRVRVQTEGILP